MHLLLYRILSALKSRITTFIFLVKYSWIVKKEGNIVIGSNVKLIPFWWEHERLNVLFKNNSRIKSNVIIQGSGRLVIGENSYISSFCVIGVNEYIEIGANVMIADCVSIRDTDHIFSNIEKPIISQGKITQPIIIKDNVWIGHGVVITKGVTIHTGAIIGANAVVTKDVPENSIIGGIPGALIRTRK